MELVPIKTECHSGYKDGEYPKKFTWEDIEFNITEITDRWHEGYNKPASSSANYFKVKTNLAGSYLLRHEIETDMWFMVL